MKVGKRPARRFREILSNMLLDGLPFGKSVQEAAGLCIEDIILKMVVYDDLMLAQSLKCRVRNRSPDRNPSCRT